MSDLSEKMILDFTETPAVSTWEAIDDRIMGGSSLSRPEYIDKVGLRFSGAVSLENNGGFASIRSNSAIYNLGKYSGIKLRLRGDGKTYKLSLRTDLFFDGVSYQADFTTRQDTWQEISLPFEDFTATHHGVKLTTIAPMDTTKVESFGLFIADQQEGPFQLEIAWAKGA